MSRYNGLSIRSSASCLASSNNFGHQLPAIFRQIKEFSKSELASINCRYVPTALLFISHHGNRHILTSIKAIDRGERERARDVRLTRGLFLVRTQQLFSAHPAHDMRTWGCT